MRCVDPNRSLKCVCRISSDLAAANLFLLSASFIYASFALLLGRASLTQTSTSPAGNNLSRALASESQQASLAYSLQTFIMKEDNPIQYRRCAFFCYP